MMGMGHGDRQRIGGILGLGIRLRQEDAYHHANLGFFAPAGAHHGLLDQQRGIFGDRDAGERRGEEDDACLLYTSPSPRDS